MELGSLQRAGLKRPPVIFFDYVLKKISTALTELTHCEQVVTEADKYAISYLQQNIVRKRAPKVATSDLKIAALRGFLEREKVNLRINQSCTFGYSDGRYAEDTRESKVLNLAARIIKSMLGKAPSIEELCRMAEFGNGASATLSRRESHREKKYLGELTTTRKLLPLASIAVNGSPAWQQCSDSSSGYVVDAQGNVSLHPDVFTIIHGSTFDTVPKDCETDRVIMKEPMMNGFLQKGLGAHIRRRLRSFTFEGYSLGVDLNNSGKTNSELAREGSISGVIATVDGKRASDSLTIALFDRCFPEDWYELFMTLRSPYTNITDSERTYVHKLQMMAGMGNGFTFEAESVIFYAIGLASTLLYSGLPFGELVVSIHGDDLVIPSDVFDIVALTYDFMGVEVNREKSFFHGPFRESCGGHWYNGLSVKPFYVKKQTGSCRGDWFWLANSLLLWLCDRNDTAVLEKFKPLLLFIRWYAASGKPESYIASLDHGRRSGLYGTKPPKLRGAWFYTRAVVEKSMRSPLPEEGRYLAWLTSPTGQQSVLDLLRHRSGSPSGDYSLEETSEHEGKRRFSTFIPITHSLGRT